MRGKGTRTLGILMVASVVGLSSPGLLAQAKEHPGQQVGKEHPGQEQKEHPGQKQAGKEHPGKEHPGMESGKFTAAQIKNAMTSHIEAQTKQGDGAFQLHDATTNQHLSLTFVKIHDPVRKVEGRGYFACTDFKSPKGEVYDLDFWLQPKDGKLVVTETQIHKLNGAARFTYKDDEAVPLSQ